MFFSGLCTFYTLTGVSCLGHVSPDSATQYTGWDVEDPRGRPLVGPTSSGEKKKKHWKLSFARRFTRLILFVL